jgi:hypothetical protein
MSVAGFAYWGFQHGFAPAQIDHFTSPVWFGGIALLVHWISNRTRGVPEVFRCDHGCPAAETCKAIHTVGVQCKAHPASARRNVIDGMGLPDGGRDGAA